MPEFQEKVEQLIIRARRDNLDLRVGTGVRGPWAQGVLWSQARSLDEVQRRRKVLTSAGAPTMASYLRDESAGLGPQSPASLPGQSWHQWGEAADVYVIVGGLSVWAGSIAEKVHVLCKELKIVHAMDFPRNRRRWHIQLREVENPLLIRGFCDGWADVEAAMAEKFQTLPIE